ncbi:DUF2431 domain-containing protein [Heracleum sosnowskyi]|uniref:DUF2431 domain-containing protein n=1 Tax=Heracleum sosnowskyi TaxID=360622 RepID=A0AAD8H8E2_9APIA|nr:DUF2431 domain-containing protein [Heracleum sosnowskyi]
MGERRIKHYSSNHKILLVGEGDFSFSKCLASAFGTGANITATSLDTKEWLQRKHRHAMVNVKELGNLGCTIIHGVSARSMKDHPQLQSKYFDRIVFNFPHSGFSHRAEYSYHMIKRHRKLVWAFLINASEMLTTKGQVHVRHKTTYPYSEWHIEELAEEAGLRLLKKSPFDINEFDGYVNKKGDGSKCDKSFPVGNSCTYKFAL